MKWKIKLLIVTKQVKTRIILISADFFFYIVHFFTPLVLSFELR